MEARTARLTILVDPRKKALFEELCAAEDQTPSQVVRRLIRQYIEKLITHRANTSMTTATEAAKQDVIAKFTRHFHEVFEGMDQRVKDLFTESVSDGEDPTAFVHAKLKVKSAVNFIGAYEDAVARAAHRESADGVICGHIHHAAMHDRMGIDYMNCGDWVESCTALAERHDGSFEIIRWMAFAGEDAIVDLAEAAEPIAA